MAERKLSEGGTETRQTEPHARHFGRRTVIAAGLVMGILAGVSTVILKLPVAADMLAAVSRNAVHSRTGQSVSAAYGAQAEIGKQAPDFTLKTLDGGEVTLSDLRGQAVLINFWATWCGPCRLEMPELIHAYEAHKGEGFVILALNLTAQDSLPDVKAFAEEFELPFPVLLDETGAVSTDLYPLRGLPTSIFIDHEGMIARIYLGAMTGEQIDQFVAELLQ